MRIVFAGTPDISATVLKRLLEQGHQVSAVYTQPDRPAGRGQKLSMSPVKELAQSHGIAVYQPHSLRQPEAQAELAALQPDLMIVVAYGLILPQAVLDIPRLGCWNVHVSLLPRWRGAAPIQRAIEAGDKTTGATIMQMDAGLDTGPILHFKPCEIAATDTSQTLHDRLAELGATALLETLAMQSVGKLHQHPQSELNVTYAKKLSKEEAAIDWQQSAARIVHKIQAFNPWPVAQTTLGEHTIRVWLAECIPVSHQAVPGTVLSVTKYGIDIAAKEGVVRVLQLQFPGARALKVSDVVNNAHQPLQVGTVCQ